MPAPPLRLELRWGASLAHRSLSSVAAPTSGRALKFAESARSAKGVVEPLGGAASCLTTQVRGHRGESLLGADFNAETITVTFIDKDGEEEVIEAPVGKSLLEIAHMNDIELEGACEGSLACSTCHVIVEDEEQFDLLDEIGQEPTDDENDMLDLAFGLTETSRLGCQIICCHELEGLRVRIPSATRNMAVDGFVPKPH
ncbi:ferredoxin [Chloropicon primus]|uniref:2Fe-2S ferredoxin n=1 Tax=Chloropicon primus TaxID=1764295 RepID=A0A5B8MZQ4_9CHLO|nr:ferredoxin [Chloropicon primus]|eukprot:QDZ26063.1 ferredoxin [Chloropicon primus]